MLNFHFVFTVLLGTLNIGYIAVTGLYPTEQRIMHFLFFARAADASCVGACTDVNERNSLTTFGDARVRAAARVQTAGYSTLFAPTAS